MITLLDPTGTTAAQFSRTDLNSSLKEHWLQDLLFAQPALIPYDEIEPGAGSVIPLCRELSLPKPGGSVFLDMLGVAPNGRLVLVECKLWRNPQARREVVAQILEYAALLRRWSYADLTGWLKAKRGWTGENPIFDHASQHGVSLGETAFSDAVNRSLRCGDFELIVAGDGIREDMAAIAEHLQHQGSRLTLVEFQIWKDPDGTTLVVPQIPFRTEIVRQTILVASDGGALQVQETENDDVETIMDPNVAKARSEKRQLNRAFWQRFIDEIVFDHPDQGKPDHGGDNWVKIPLPAGSRLTAYRTASGLLGVFLAGENKSENYKRLALDEDEIRAEAGLEDLRFHALNAPEDRSTIGIDRRRKEFGGDDGELEWLKDAANRLVNALRPKLAALGGK